MHVNHDKTNRAYTLAFRRYVQLFVNKTTHIIFNYSTFSVPTSPAEARLIDYEARMSKIRLKNHEKMIELRKKLDARLGVGGGVGGGVAAGSVEGGGKEKEGKKEDFGFKFPYDTLRRRRSKEVRNAAKKKQQQRRR